MRKPFIHTMPIPGCESYNQEKNIKRNTCDKITEIILKI